MSEFIVSARKYRPGSFSEVIGQEHVTATLENAVKSGKIAHAYLFCGPRGVGKTTCARILSKVLNDDTSNDPESQSLNIFELDAASNNSVEDMRNLVEQVRFAPQSGKYKVYIIDEVHMLSQAAFNAFLKTLEEPPPFAIFILATTEKHKVLPTILSRCQIYDFRRVSVESIVNHLKGIVEKEGIKADEDALHIIAQKADGSVRDSLSLFDRLASYGGDELTYDAVVRNLNVLDYDYFFRVTDMLLQQDSAQLMLLFDEVLGKGFNGDDFIIGLGEHFRNLLMCKDQQTLQLLEVSEKLRERYQNQAQAVPDSILLSCLNLANDCDIHYKTNKNKRLLVELYLLKMCYVKQAIQANAVSNSSQGYEKKKSDQPVLNEPAPEEETPLEETPKTPVLGPKPKDAIRKSPKLTSLEDLAKQVEETNQKEEVPEATESAEKEVVSAPARPLDEDKFYQAWRQYIDRQKAAKKTTFHLDKLEPEFEGHRVTFTVKDNTQKDLLDDESYELAEFLRNAIGNPNIELNFNVSKVETKEEKVVYTSKEREQLLIEKNPKLKDLKDRLGLDLDY